MPESLGLTDAAAEDFTAPEGAAASAAMTPISAPQIGASLDAMPLSATPLNAATQNSGGASGAQGLTPASPQAGSAVSIQSDSQGAGSIPEQSNGTPPPPPVNVQLSPGANAVVAASAPASTETEPLTGNDSDTTQDEAAPGSPASSSSVALPESAEQFHSSAPTIAPTMFSQLEVQARAPKRGVTDHSSAGNAPAISKPDVSEADNVPSVFQINVSGTLAALPVELQPTPSLLKGPSLALPVLQASAADANAASTVTPAPNGNSSLSGPGGGPGGANHNPGTPSADNPSSAAPTQNAANKDSNASAATNSSDPIAHPTAAVITAQTAGLQSTAAQSTMPPQPAAAALNGPAAQIAAGQTAAPASAPKANNGSTANGADAAANAAASEPPPPAAVAPVQMAQMVNKAAQSEMRIGLNTAAFGNVEVHTVVHANDVGVLIGSEKGDLHSLMANDLPGIANTLQQQNLRLSQVNFHQGSGFSGNLSSGSDSQPRHFVRSQSAALSSAEGRGSDPEPGAAEGPRDISAGLNILA